MAEIFDQINQFLKNMEESPQNVDGFRLAWEKAEINDLKGEADYHLAALGWEVYQEYLRQQDCFPQWQEKLSHIHDIMSEIERKQSQIDERYPESGAEES